LVLLQPVSSNITAAAANMLFFIDGSSLVVSILLCPFAAKSVFEINTDANQARE
jgi:hypothetical protein